MDGWAKAFRAKLAPALNMPQHGIFVSGATTLSARFGPARILSQILSWVFFSLCWQANNCHRHHNIDGPEAFATTIGGVSLVEAVHKWLTEPGAAPKLLDEPLPGGNPTCLAKAGQV